MEKKLINLHKRCIRITEYIQILESINAELRNVMESDLDLSLETISYVNTTLDKNNSQIHKGKKLHKRVFIQIIELMNFNIYKKPCGR